MKITRFQTARMKDDGGVLFRDVGPGSIGSAKRPTCVPPVVVDAGAGAAFGFGFHTSRADRANSSTDWGL